MRPAIVIVDMLKGHSIRGTEGAEVMAGLHQGPADFYVPKG